jgi:hypothetical protein
MFSDPATLSFALTYLATLAAALLMFIGQLTAFGVFLVLVGSAQLAAYSLKALVRAFSKPEGP